MNILFSNETDGMTLKILQQLLFEVRVKKLKKYKLEVNPKDLLNVRNCERNTNNKTKKYDFYEDL